MLRSRLAFRCLHKATVTALVDNPERFGVHCTNIRLRRLARIFHGRLLALFVLLSALFVALALTFAVLRILLLAAGFLFAQCLAQHSRVVLGVLLKIFHRHTVTG